MNPTMKQVEEWKRSCYAFPRYNYERDKQQMADLIVALARVMRSVVVKHRGVSPGKSTWDCMCCKRVAVGEPKHFDGCDVLAAQTKLAELIGASE